MTIVRKMSIFHLAVFLNYRKNEEIFMYIGKTKKDPLAPSVIYTDLTGNAYSSLTLAHE